MFDRTRWFLSAVLIVSFCAAGCGEDNSAETPPDEGAAAAAADGEDAASADAAESADADAESTPAPAAEAAPVQTGPIKDVAIAPSAQENPMKGAFIFYTANDGAAAVGEFHQKDLEGKGWKLARNASTKLAVTTLTGVVQQYEKGADVLTVLLTEQIAEKPNTSVCVMDIPLPPTTTFINPFGGQGSGEIGEPPAQVIAWLTKELTARGWKADPPKETGGTHSATFRKGQRTFTTQLREIGGGRKGSSFYFMHMG